MTAIAAHALYVASQERSPTRTLRAGVSKEEATLRRPENSAVVECADMRLADVLAQPLTAASNYVGTARLLLLSTETNATALVIENLECAEVQIVRAGAIFRQFRERKD